MELPKLKRKEDWAAWRNTIQLISNISPISTKDVLLCIDVHILQSIKDPQTFVDKDLNATLDTLEDQLQMKNTSKSQLFQRLFTTPRSRTAKYFLHTTAPLMETIFNKPDNTTAEEFLKGIHLALATAFVPSYVVEQFQRKPSKIDDLIKEVERVSDLENFKSVNTSRNSSAGPPRQFGKPTAESGRTWNWQPPKHGYGLRSATYRTIAEEQPQHGYNLRSTAARDTSQRTPTAYQDYPKGRLNIMRRESSQDSYPVRTGPATMVDHGSENANSRIEDEEDSTVSSNSHTECCSQTTQNILELSKLNSGPVKQSPIIKPMRSPKVLVDILSPQGCLISKATALVDTGAELTVVSHELATKLKLPLVNSTKTIMCAGDNKVVCSNLVRIAIKLGDNVFNIEAYVLPNSHQSIILGTDVLGSAKIDMTRRCVTIGRVEVKFIQNDNIVTCAEDTIIHANSSRQVAVCFENSDNELTPLIVELLKSDVLHLVDRSSSSIITLDNVTNTDKIHKKGELLGTFSPLEEGCLRELCPIELSSVETGTNGWLDQLLEKNRNIFAKDKLDLGKTKLCSFDINTNGQGPIKSRCNRYSPKQREEISRQIKDMKNSSIIRESSSPWCSPIVLARKSDNSWRLCVDYRRLNAITVKDSFPMPNITDLLDSLGGANIFSKLDLASGFWQIPLTEDARAKTAFTTHEGLFEFLVLPFGLANAPGAFNRLMNIVFRSHKNFVMHYMDDVIVYSKNKEDHKKHLEMTFSALRKAGLKLREEKCEFLREELTFLGHTINANGISANKDRIEAIEQIPYPTNEKEVRSFVGLMSYYRRFIKNFATIASPLYALLKKDAEFKFGDPERKAVEDLKSNLKSSSMMSYPRPNQPFMISTDASSTGIGAVLSQEDESGEEKPIAFASRILSKAERNYATVERECLAIIWALQIFRTYIYGERIFLHTDHQPLKYLLQSERLTNRLARWALQLSEHNIEEIRYTRGKDNVVADVLSRSHAHEVINMISEDHAGLQLDYVSQLQHNDVDLQQMFKLLEDGVWPNQISSNLQAHLNQMHLYCIIDNVLYKGTTKGDVKTTRRDRLFLVVPPTLKHEILRANHGEPVAGHFGFKKTAARIYERYYWPHMSQDIMNYCQCCMDCQTRKTSKKLRFPLQPLEASRPFEMVCTDFMGPFKESDNGNKYIMVVTDKFTKYVEAWALPACDALTTAKCLVDNWITKYGPPEQLLSDKGSNFMSQLVDNLLKLTSTTQLRTAAYHPQCNGQTERFNQVLKTQLSMYVNQRGSNWDEHLQLIMFAYRTTKHSSTGMTPYEALWGRNPRLFQDTALMDQPEEEWRNLHEYLQDLRTVLTTNQTKLKENLDKAAAMMKKYHDKNLNVVTFDVGDYVLLRTMPNSKSKCADYKLQHRYSGPYKVIERKSDKNYRILDEQSGKHQVVTAERLKLFHDLVDTSQDRLPDPPNPTADESADNEEREITRIIGERTVTNKNKRNILEYLVRFKDSAEEAWISASNVHAPRLVDEWTKYNNRSVNTMNIVRYPRHSHNAITISHLLMMLLCVCCITGAQGFFEPGNQSEPLMFCETGKKPHVLVRPRSTCHNLACFGQMGSQATNSSAIIELYSKRKRVTTNGYICHRLQTRCWTYKYLFGGREHECTTESMWISKDQCRTWKETGTTQDGTLVANTPHIHSTHNNIVLEYWLLSTTHFDSTNVFVYEEQFEFQLVNNSYLFSDSRSVDPCLLKRGSCLLIDHKLAIWDPNVCPYLFLKSTRCHRGMELQVQCTSENLDVTDKVVVSHECRKNFTFTQQGLYLTGDLTKISPHISNLPTDMINREHNALVLSKLQHLEDREIEDEKFMSCFHEYYNCRSRVVLYADIAQQASDTWRFVWESNSLVKKKGDLILEQQCTPLFQYHLTYENCTNKASIVTNFQGILTGRVLPFTNRFVLNLSTGCDSPIVYLPNYIINTAKQQILYQRERDVDDVEPWHFNRYREIEEDFHKDNRLIIHGFFESEDFVEREQVQVHQKFEQTSESSIDKVGEYFDNLLTQPVKILGIGLGLIALVIAICLGCKYRKHCMPRRRRRRSSLSDFELPATAGLASRSLPCSPHVSTVDIPRNMSFRPGILRRTGRELGGDSYTSIHYID